MGKNIFRAVLLSAFLLSQTMAGDYRAISAFDGGHITAMSRSGDRVFAALLNGGVFYSNDEGGSWKKPSQDPTMGQDLSYMSASETNVYVGNRTTLYRLDIATGKWEDIRQKLANAQPSALALTGLDSDGEMVAAMAGSIVYISLDEGNTWMASPVLINFSSVAPPNLLVRNSVLYGNGRGGIVSSPDSGKTWFEPLSFPDSPRFSRLSKSGTELWAATHSGMFHYPWGDVKYDEPARMLTPVAAKGIPVNRLPIERVMEADGKVWAIGSEGVFLSKNMGADFVSLPLPAASNPGPITSLVRKKNGILLGSTKEGVVSVNEDGTSRLANAGISGRTISDMAFHQGTVFAMVDGLGLHSSRDKGRTWQKTASIANHGTSEGSFTVVEGELYLIQGNSIYRYQDKDLSFASVSFVKTTSPVTAFGIHSGRMYAGTEMEGLFMSEDNGKSWGRMVLHLDRNFDGRTVRSLASVGNTLFATVHGQGLTASGLFEFLPDSSQWRRLRPDAELGIQDFNYVLARTDTLFATTPNDIFISLDKGSTWKPLGAFNSLANPAIARFSSSGTFISVVSQVGAAYSEDLGATWTHLLIPGTLILSAIQVEDNHLLLGTNGRSLWSYHPQGAPPQGILKRVRARGGVGGGLIFGNRHSVFPTTPYSLTGRRLQAIGTGGQSAGAYVMPKTAETQ